MKDRQLEGCISWLERVELQARIFEEPSIENLSGLTVKYLKELEKLKEKEESDGSH